MGRHDCYHASWRCLMESDEDLVLVHGIVIGQGPIAGVKFGHAWLEFKKYGASFVYDAKVDMVIPKELFYAMAGCDYFVTYGKEEAYCMALETGHYGPWDEKIATTAHV